MDNEKPVPTITSPRRAPAAIHAICTIISSWFLMQVVHESGHALAAVLTDGRVLRVVLVPWELSRTDLGQNPHPLIVAWAGPVMGVLLPLTAWLLARGFNSAYQHWLRFFAGFCLIANGAYIGFGSFTGDGDAGDLLRYGSPGWLLQAFLVATVPLGFFIWHRLGQHFSFGQAAHRVNWTTAAYSVAIALTIIMIESIIAAI